MKKILFFLILLFALPCYGKTNPYISNLSSSNFSPLDLFSGGKAGFWYDPSDLSTMFQDSAGTTPVTTTGQSVCKINDKSGNNLHASQATTGKCPVLQSEGGRYYLAFNGGNVLITNTVDLGSFSYISTVYGIYIGSTSLSVVSEFSANTNTNAKAFYPLVINGESAGHFEACANGSSSATHDLVQTTSSSFTSGNKLLATTVIDNTKSVAADRIVLRANGSGQGTSTVLDTASSSNLGNYPFYIGGRGTTPTIGLTGRIYSIVSVTKLLTGDDLFNIEGYANGKTAAY
jgi:hypothetical protein